MNNVNNEYILTSDLAGEELYIWVNEKPHEAPERQRLTSKSDGLRYVICICEAGKSGKI